MQQSIMIEADKGRNLRLNTNALSKMEEMLGKSASNFEDGMGFREIRAVVFCGLRWEDKNLTLEGAGDIVDIVIAKKGIEYLTEVINRALSLALGESQVQKGNHPALKQ